MKLWFEKGAWASKKAKKLIKDIKPDQVKSIAVIRHAALGDMVLVRCFVIELRRWFPNASITLSVVSNYNYGVPADLVDRVHVMIGSDQRQTPFMEQFRKAKELGYHDLLFDLAATTRSFYLCLLNKARLKIGFPYRLLQRYIYYDATILRSDLKFEAETMLDMLNLIGCKTKYPPRFDMPHVPMKRIKPYVVYFTSASIPTKCWPDDRFSGLIGRLSQDYPDFEHIVLKGVAEWESIDEVMKPLKELDNVTGMDPLSLDETISLCKGATMVVSNDTGIRNLAIATDTPTLGLFFLTVPYRYWPRYGLHDAAYNPDGSLPSVDKVYEMAKGIMDKQVNR